MKTYQIAYYSPLGHIKKLAQAISQVLPPQTVISDLEKDCESCADIHLVGFELSYNKPDMIPLKVIEYLEKLEDKTVLLFATVPLEAGDHLKQRITLRIMPFMPSHCQYCGIYLCSAEPPATALEAIRSRAAEDPQHKRVQNWLQRFENVIGHPNETDIQNACSFVRRVLRLEESQ